MKAVCFFVLPLAAAVVFTQALAGGTTTQEDVADVAFDVTAGEELYMKECRGCHGPTAKGVSSYPKLVGQPAEYLVERLERYRAGEKIGPNTMLMAPRAKNLSDQDIGNVVAFIKSLE